jgi:PAS domain-containing protein
MSLGAPLLLPSQSRLSGHYMKLALAAASVGTAIVLLVAADDIVAFIRTAQDAATRRSSERFRDLIQSVPIAVIALDREGQVTTWNQAAEKVFGWQFAEVIGAFTDHSLR